MKRYEYMQIGIASPEEILSWSYGEVKKSETINYRTYKPEKDGLFCEVIFGPQKDYQCGCGKSKRTTEKGKKCEKCGVELTESKVRRERMGHIELAAPVVHTWFLRNSPSKIALMLDMKTKEVEEIVYLNSYIVFDPGDLEGMLHKGQMLSAQELTGYKRTHIGCYFKALTGAEAIKQLLHDLNLEQISKDLRLELKTATKQKREKIIKRLEVVEAFKDSGNKPEWMVMTRIPVLPPDLRPMVQLDGGRFATTDLNDLYRRILIRNARLRREFDQNAPDLITKNEKRLLQEAVDALIDNGKKNRKVVVNNNRPLKSLSDLLRGKQGRFRQNLLGKRVDYSGRSVIAVGPDLQMYQCGIPREMALILFKPFIINKLMAKNANQPEIGGNRISIKRAKEMIEEGHPDALEQVEKVIVEHPVLLNRAPTLHRLGIQAFEPKLVEGKAIRLHPLVCTAFNADFDGDQMAVHVPLSEEAQAEARLLMLASKNILAPKDGKPIVTPGQDMVLGNYYLTIEDVDDERNGRVFKDPREVELAYENDQISLHTRIFLPVNCLDNSRFTPEQREKYICTSYGKLIFNTIFPKHVINIETNTEFEDLPYVNEAETKNLTVGVDDRFLVSKGTNLKEWLAKWFDETHQIDALDRVSHALSSDEFNEVNAFAKDHSFEEVFAKVKDLNANIDDRTIEEAFSKKWLIPHPFKKKFLSDVIAEVFKRFKLAETSKVLDKMKDLGFKYSTVSGITVSVYDIENVSTKAEKIKKADEEIETLQDYYAMGWMSEEEKKKNVIKIWETTKDSLQNDIAKEMKKHFIDNHIYMMADSGARGSVGNYVQLSGMRGLMAKPNGESMDIPIKASFREGLTMAEFFTSSHGSRKGSTDTALKTAESGYLTRRLVDVSQEVVVREDDCGTDQGIEVVAILDEKGKTIETLEDRIRGRFSNEDVVDPNTGEVLAPRGTLINDQLASKICKAGVTKVNIRSLLTCTCRNGVCVKCYGSDLSTGEVVEKGETVGIIAAQSIGEPGTQLTMRTFHSGGVAGGEDITQGLPRIQELFEAREPKGKAIISEIDGIVESITLEKDHRYQIKISHVYNDKPVTRDGNKEYKTYLTDSGKEPLVKEGDRVKAGDKLTAGLIHPKELLRVSTVINVADYILREVQKVYSSQSAIADKHVEIIIKQMLQKVVVVDEGDTNLLPGSNLSKAELYDIYKECLESGKRPPVVKPVLLGITRSSLKSDSFLSAASFQETTRILTETAIRGKKDTLEGLKENLIIGGLIPAGTGAIEVTEDNLYKIASDDDCECDECHHDHESSEELDDEDYPEVDENAILG